LPTDWLKNALCFILYSTFASSMALTKPKPRRASGLWNAFRASVNERQESKQSGASGIAHDRIEVGYHRTAWFRGLRTVCFKHRW
jgi:hypothetical protein